MLMKIILCWLLSYTYVLCSLELSAQSENHWNGGAGNVAHFCDHHRDEVRWGYIIDEVEEAQGVDALPVRKKVTLATASRYKVIGVTCY